MANTCPNCGGDIAIKNPTGRCDHLYYPENLPKKSEWTLERALAFARDLVNSDNRKFRKIGRMMCALKDENLIRACEMCELLTAPKNG